VEDDDLNEIAVHEVRIFDKHGNLKKVVPEKTVGEVLAVTYKGEGYYQMSLTQRANVFHSHVGLNKASKRGIESYQDGGNIYDEGIVVKEESNESDII
jgi:hypothetical protein